MDIFDDVALRRPIAYALNLVRLPNELVYNVLEELPLVKILQILAHKNQRLNHCVLTHQKWRRLFNSQLDIDQVIDNFILYNEICRFTCSKIAAGVWYFNRGCNAREFGTTVKVRDLHQDVVTAIKGLLPSSKQELALLEAHSDAPYPAESSDIAGLWAWVKQAKRRQNKAKNKQLTLVADILAKYPEMLMIKKTLDPAQGSPRKNLKHIETIFRRRAKKVLQNPQLRFRGTIFCRKGIDNIELVPYDRYLWLFLDTLVAHSYDHNADDNIDKSREYLYKHMSKLAVSRSESDGGASTDVYPPNIRVKIDKVLEGFGHVYTGSAQLSVERIE